MTLFLFNKAFTVGNISSLLYLSFSGSPKKKRKKRKKSGLCISLLEANPANTLS
jgi:hypothetical protein